jgi:hypothetical protein
VSCVDLSHDGGEYGFYGHCIREGSAFEGKILAALCCPGLVFREPEVISSKPELGFPDGCASDLRFSPSELICLACGDGICEPDENYCDCPEDCTYPLDASGE